MAPDPENPPPARSARGRTLPIEGLPTTHLLGEIHDRLQRFEQDLALRDQRVTRLQQELQETHAALAAERGERGKAVRAELDERVREAQKRLAEEMNAGRQREARLTQQLERQRELMVELEALRLAHAQALEALTEARLQLAERQEQDRTLSEPALIPRKPAPGDSSQLPHPAVSSYRTQGRWKSLPQRQRRLVAAVATAAVALSLLIGSGSFLLMKPVYRVTAAILTSAVPEDLESLSATAIKPERPAVLQSLRLESRGSILFMVAQGRDPADTRAALDGVGRDVAARLEAALALPVLPDRSREREAIEIQLREIEQGLAETGPPAPADDAWGDLVNAWQEGQAERESIRERLNVLAAELVAPGPAEADVVLDPRRVRALETGDWKLQADTEALAQREVRLVRLLEEASAACSAGLERLQAALPSAEAALTGSLQTEGGDSEVTELLDIVQQGLNTLQQAASGLINNLAQSRPTDAALPQSTQAGEPTEPVQLRVPDAQHDAPPAAATRPATTTDGLTWLAAAEPAVRLFVEHTAAATERINQALDALGQGGDQPTRRLVLRNTVARALEDPSSTLRAATSGARQLLLSDNVELAAAAQGVAALRVQVQEQRDRLLARLRSEALAELEADHQKQLAAIRAEEEQSIQRDAELNAAILRHSQAALGVLAAGLEERRAAARHAELQRERAEAVARLAALDQADLRDLASLPPPTVVRYVPADTAMPALSTGSRLLRAAAWGILPLLAFALTLGMIAGVHSWRHSRQVMAEYAEVLNASSRGKKN